MTQKQLINTVTESIKNYILNEEDGKWVYISNVLYRYGIKHNMIEHDGKNIICLNFNDDSQKDEVGSFLNKMGYFIDNEESTANSCICYSDAHRPLNEELTKKDVMEIVKKDKEFEKKIKDIVRDTVTDLFRVLYQHNGIFRSLGNN